MKETSQILPVSRGPYRLHAEIVPGGGLPVVLMHGFPDNTPVAHDASGPSAIDWALANPGRVARLVLLNTYYHFTPPLRRPPAIALYSTPVVRRSSGGGPAWTGGCMPGRSAGCRSVSSSSRSSTRISCPPGRSAFWRLNDDLLATVLTRRLRVPQMHRFGPPIRVIFGARDRYLNPRVARNFAALFPHSELHLLDRARHYVQVDQPQQVADLIASD